MSRCGSCPIYGNTEFAVQCPGDFGVEECADKLQELYWAIYDELKTDKKPSKTDDACKPLHEKNSEENQPAITAKRAVELINGLIDHMINDAGGHSREVLDILLCIGFTKEELVNEFRFAQDDVNDVLEKSEEDS